MAESVLVNRKSSTESKNDESRKIQPPHISPLHQTASLSLLTDTDRILIGSGAARNARREKNGQEPSQKLDITGFKHLLMLILVVGNVKMLFADFYTYGIWDTLNHFGFGTHDLKMGAIITLSNFVYTPISLGIETAASYKSNNFVKRHGTILHCILCSIALVFGSTLTWQNIQHPLVGTACEANVIVTFMKLVSFACTNHNLRICYEQNKPVPKYYETGPAYPNNLTFSNAFYFWFAPTLIYQPVYPMRKRIRWARVISLAVELVMTTLLFWVLLMQLAMPALAHFSEHQDSVPVMVEDFLSLCTIDVSLWLIGFFALFQLVLNLVAEVTKFGDRTFYLDWWNAGSVGTFWRDWNLPVSNFFRRHIYIPLRSRGVSKPMAANVVFFASAVMHEVLFGIATHNFNGIAFTCMIIQPLFVYLTEGFEHSRGKGTTVGNCVMWFCMMVGQPTAVIIYYEQWIRNNQTPSVSREWMYWFPALSGAKK